MELCDLLKRNLDIFAWKPTDMTGVPWFIAEHRLNICEGCPPIRQKKKGQAPNRNKAIQEEVTKLVEAHIMREVVHFHQLALNTRSLLKKHDKLLCDVLFKSTRNKKSSKTSKKLSEEDKHEIKSQEMHLRCKRRDVPKLRCQHEGN
ncbi:hypothetical protein Tco_0831267 [Tanacetum coccineum]